MLDRDSAVEVLVTIVVGLVGVVGWVVRIVVVGLVVTVTVVEAVIFVCNFLVDLVTVFWAVVGDFVVAVD